MNPTMQRMYVGVDVHKSNHAVSITDCFEQVLMEKQISNEASVLRNFLNQVNELSRQRNLEPIFGLEDGYSYGSVLAKFLVENNCQVKIIHPVLVDRLRKQTAHPEKNDFLDAKGVAKVLIREQIDRLPSYIISKDAENAKILQELSNDREFLIKERVRIKNQLHHLLYLAYGSENYKTKFKYPFSPKSLQYWRRHPAPERTENSLLTHQIIRKVKRLQEVTKEAKDIEQEMQQMIKESKSNLQTMPGCGNVVTTSILAEVKDITRFRNSSCFAKYAGLAPRECSSGKKTKHHKTKGGNRKLNTAIHRIALTQIGNRGLKEAKEYFQRKVSEGKTKMEALTCLKRRIANIVYAMLRDNSVYHPKIV